MRKRSLLLRAVLVQLAVFSLILLVVNIVNIRQALRAQTGNFDILQSTVARGAASIAESNLVNLELLRANARLLENTYRESNQLSGGAVEPFYPILEIWTASGQLLYRTAGRAPFGVLPEAGTFTNIRYLGGNWRLYTAAGKEGKLRLVLAESLDRRRACVTPRWRDVGINLLLLFCVFWVSSWIALRAGLRPLRALASELTQRQPQALQPVSTGLNYLETRPLVTALNGMMERVAASVQREQAFLADAAHELRTPITAIQVQLHGLLNARSEGEREEIGRDIQQGLDRASSLARQLIALARLQSEGFVMRRVAVDLVELARDRIAAYVPLARSRNIALAYCGAEQAMLEADPVALASVLDNLLDNAIKYGVSGGQVEVDVRGETDRIVMCVRDDGTGVPPEYRARLCERFFRVPDVEASGSGLGLAIVRGLVERHGGTVVVGDGLEGRGVSFTITLPAK